MQKCSNASLKSGIYALTFSFKRFLTTNVAKNSNFSDVGSTRGPNVVMLVFKASHAIIIRSFDNVTPTLPLASSSCVKQLKLLSSLALFVQTM
ncbi:hypothetical protein HN51_068274 [Arachis hypogaea]